MSWSHPVISDDDVQVWQGDCRTLLPYFHADGIDACVTDPPYDLTAGKKGGSGPASVGVKRNPYAAARIGANNGGFMGKDWDATGVAFDPATWAEVLRVLKPGGFLVAFGGTRTYHRMTCAIEDAGFEIRDSLHWIYLSGFPKSMDCGEGRGTALKPAHEPIVLARKPLERPTVAANLAEHGTGALNIDACRVGDGTESAVRVGEPSQDRRYTGDGATNFAALPGARGGSPNGRWPTNVLLDDGAAAELDAQSGVLTSGKMMPTHTVAERRVYGQNATGGYTTMETYGDSGGASRVFPIFRYEPKAPQHERPIVDGFSHATVKPVDLMRWLVRLVTPPGGTVLDPFFGSGTTGEAAILEGRHCAGIELTPEHLPLIRARLSKPMQTALFAEE